MAVLSSIRLLAKGPKTKTHKTPKKAPLAKDMGMATLDSQGVDFQIDLMPITRTTGNLLDTLKWILSINDETLDRPKADGGNSVLQEGTQTTR